MSEFQIDPEARIIYVLAIALTAPIIILSLVGGIDISPGTTVCMLIAGAALLGLLIDWRHRIRLPRAQVVRVTTARSKTG